MVILIAGSELGFIREENKKGRVLLEEAHYFISTCGGTQGSLEQMHSKLIGNEMKPKQNTTQHTWITKSLMLLPLFSGQNISGIPFFFF